MRMKEGSKHGCIVWLGSSPSDAGVLSGECSFFPTIGRLEPMVRFAQSVDLPATAQEWDTHGHS